MCLASNATALLWKVRPQRPASTTTRLPTIHPSNRVWNEFDSCEATPAMVAPSHTAVAGSPVVGCREFQSAQRNAAPILMDATFWLRVLPARSSRTRDLIQLGFERQSRDVHQEPSVPRSATGMRELACTRFLNVSGIDLTFTFMFSILAPHQNTGGRADMITSQNIYAMKMTKQANVNPASSTAVWCSRLLTKFFPSYAAYRGLGFTFFESPTPG